MKYIESKYEEWDFEALKQEMYKTISVVHFYRNLMIDCLDDKWRERIQAQIDEEEKTIKEIVDLLGNNNNEK